LFSPRRIVLDELDRAAAGEERVDRIGLLRRDLGQQRLELDVRERQVQFLATWPPPFSKPSVKPFTDRRRPRSSR
jgi:hypothetical protein